jgi:hypothetical protein
MGHISFWPVAYDFHLLDEIRTLKENTEALLIGSKETGSKCSGNLVHVRIS